MIHLLSSPWHTHFDDLVRAAREELLLASPYVRRYATDRLLELLAPRATAPAIRLLTDLSVSSLLDGATEPAAITGLVDALPHTRVTLLPSLHAKVYIADASAAIVTSGNLTRAGLEHNQEYGVLLQDPSLVRQVRDDLEAFDGPPPRSAAG